ncbi:MAG: NAD(P)/FAD-dependent oxidoreductase [Methanoregulaceae archaeon]|nr:NAD(P)/FAD-dependent oxidoreductase [Methanoregulaceae archaeon]
MSRSFIIIGGGIAGLTAGCYAAMNGFDVEIHEMHTIPGGLCTAWKRGGYTFDLCIDWLCGSSPGTSLYPVWEDLGIVQGRTFAYPEYYTVAIHRSGERFTVWANPDRLKEEMLRIAPEDSGFIRQFTGDIRRLSGFDIPVDPGLWDLLKMVPNLGLFRRDAVPIPELARGIRNPVLRDLFISALDWNGQSAFFVLVNLAYMARRAAGYPLGGSVPVAKAMEERFRSLGGAIRYRSKVKEVIVENDRAAGVVLEDGTRVPADFVLSAADGFSTLFRWIPKKYVTDEILRYYRDLKPFPPLLYVSLGVRGEWPDLPWSVSFPLKEPVTIAGKPFSRLGLISRARDPSLAPPGRAVLSLMIEADYSYWEKIPYSSDTYREEKKRIGEQVLDAMEDFYPGIRDSVEVMDIATPHTFVRYTGNWQGSYQGWLVTSATMNLTLPQVLPGLKSFYMAGQWIAPGGGLPGAAISARRAVQLVCRAEGRRFVTSKT